MNRSSTDLAGSGQKPQLKLETLLSEAAGFAAIESTHDESTLYGVTDGKAVGTYLEHKFQCVLKNAISLRLEAPQRASISRV